MPTETECILRPVLDRMVVKRARSADKSQGGILLPQTAQEKSNRAEVVRVGPGITTPDGDLIPILPTRTAPGADLECGVNPGDVVILSSWSGNEVEVDGEKYLIISAHDVLAIEES